MNSLVCAVIIFFRTSLVQTFLFLLTMIQIHVGVFSFVVLVFGGATAHSEFNHHQIRTDRILPVIITKSSQYSSDSIPHYRLNPVNFDSNGQGSNYDRSYYAYYANGQQFDASHVTHHDTNRGFNINQKTDLPSNSQDFVTTFTRVKTENLFPSNAGFHDSNSDERLVPIRTNVNSPSTGFPLNRNQNPGYEQAQREHVNRDTEGLEHNVNPARNIIENFDLVLPASSSVSETVKPFHNRAQNQNLHKNENLIFNNRQFSKSDRPSNAQSVSLVSQGGSFHHHNNENKESVFEERPLDTRPNNQMNEFIHQEHTPSLANHFPGSQEHKIMSSQDSQFIKKNAQPPRFLKGILTNPVTSVHNARQKFPHESGAILIHNKEKVPANLEINKPQNSQNSFVHQKQISTEFTVPRIEQNIPVRTNFNDEGTVNNQNKFKGTFLSEGQGFPQAPGAILIQNNERIPANLEINKSQNFQNNFVPRKQIGTDLTVPHINQSIPVKRKFNDERTVDNQNEFKGTFLSEGQEFPQESGAILIQNKEIVPENLEINKSQNSHNSFVPHRQLSTEFTVPHIEQNIPVRTNFKDEGTVNNQNEFKGTFIHEGQDFPQESGAILIQNNERVPTNLEINKSKNSQISFVHRKQINTEFTVPHINQNIPVRTNFNDERTNDNQNEFKRSFVSEGQDFPQESGAILIKNKERVPANLGVNEFHNSHNSFFHHRQLSTEFIAPHINQNIPVRTNFNDERTVNNQNEFKGTFLNEGQDFPQESGAILIKNNERVPANLKINKSQNSQSSFVHRKQINTEFTVPHINQNIPVRRKFNNERTIDNQNEFKGTFLSEGQDFPQESGIILIQNNERVPANSEINKSQNSQNSFVHRKQISTEFTVPHISQNIPLRKSFNDERTVDNQNDIKDTFLNEGKDFPEGISTQGQDGLIEEGINPTVDSVQKESPQVDGHHTDIAPEIIDQPVQREKFLVQENQPPTSTPSTNANEQTTKSHSQTLLNHIIRGIQKDLFDGRDTRIQPTNIERQVSVPQIDRNRSHGKSLLGNIISGIQRDIFGKPAEHPSQ